MSPPLSLPSPVGFFSGSVHYCYLCHRRQHQQNIRRCCWRLFHYRCQHPRSRWLCLTLAVCVYRPPHGYTRVALLVQSLPSLPLLAFLFPHRYRYVAFPSPITALPFTLYPFILTRKTTKWQRHYLVCLCVCTDGIKTFII